MTLEMIGEILLGAGLFITSYGIGLTILNYKRTKPPRMAVPEMTDDEREALWAKTKTGFGYTMYRPENFVTLTEDKPTNGESLMWKTIQFTTACVLIAGAAYAQTTGQQTPLPPVYPPPTTTVPAGPAVTPAGVPPDFSSGFCAGWNAAQGVEQQRYANWRALSTATRTDEGAKTPVGQVADLLINSVAVYVLIQPATGQVTLSDGRVINCTAPPAAAPAVGDKK